MQMLYDSFSHTCSCAVFAVLHPGRHGRVLWSRQCHGLLRIMCAEYNDSRERLAQRYGPTAEPRAVRPVHVAGGSGHHHECQSSVAALPRAVPNHGRGHRQQHGHSSAAKNDAASMDSVGRVAIVFAHFHWLAIRYANAHVLRGTHPYRVPHECFGYAHAVAHAVDVLQSRVS